MIKLGHWTLLVIFLFVISNLKATTINPYLNLGEMVLNTETVVKAKVIDTYQEDRNGTIYFITLLEVEEHIKGNLSKGNRFKVTNYRRKVGDLERRVWGDIDYNMDMSYLLFLAKVRTEIYMPVMLSYGAFQEHKSIDGKPILVPFGLGTERHSHQHITGKKIETLHVFDTQKLLSVLTEIVDGNSTWDATKAKSDILLENFDSNRDLPAYCETISGGIPARWENIETTPLPIYHQASGDSGCSDELIQLENAVSDIENNYPGVNLSIEGAHDFEPSCDDQGTSGSEFTTYVSTTYGDNRRHLILFDDPCDEIADLNGCNGVLGLGGTYWFNSTYVYKDEIYRNAAFGYVLINNGVGDCFCNASGDYATLLTHEITHSLNLGHITDATGDANMNPGCCNQISELDQGCVNALYEPLSLPVTIDKFTAEVNKKSVTLNWSSISETNNDYYSIQKQNDFGVFADITTINGAGNSHKKIAYEYIDVNPVSGDNVYRLLQTDRDGTESIVRSAVAFLEFENTISIQPNPIRNDLLNLTITNELTADHTIKVIAADGSTIICDQKFLTAGSNKITYDLSVQRSGLYFLQIITGDQVSTLKFINP